MEPPKEAQVNISKAEKRYYRYGSRLAGFGIFLSFISAMFLAEFAPPPEEIPIISSLHSGIQSLPTPGLLLSIGMLILGLIFIIGGSKERDRRSVDREKLFLEKLNKSPEHVNNGDPDEALNILKETFTGSNPNFVPPSAASDIEDTLRKLDENGNSGTKKEAVEVILNYIYAEYKRMDEFRDSLEEFSVEVDDTQDQDEEIPNPIVGIGTILYRNVIDTKIVKTGTKTAIAAILFAVVIFLSLSELQPVATALSSVLGAVFGAIIAKRLGE